MNPLNTAPTTQPYTDTDTDTDAALITLALQQHRMLGKLDAAARGQLQAQMQVQRVDAGQPVASGAALSERLFVLAAGAVAFMHQDSHDAPSPLQLQSPDWFGARVHATDLAGWQVVAHSPVLLASCSAEDLNGLTQQHPWLQLFIRSVSTSAATATAPESDATPQFQLLTTPVSALLRRGPVTVASHTPIAAVAEQMRQERVSSVMLVDAGRLVGLVTDRDLRNRVLAAGLDTSRPVADIATMTPLSVDIAAPGFDALLLMARHNIHHVPVLDGSRVAGMITASDVTEQHSTSPVMLVGDIHKQDSLEGLVAAAGRVKLLQKQLAAAGASAYSTGYIVTAITDALTVRLLELGQARLGQAPVAFAWVAAGSQARHEQTAKSDQDNCIVLDDSFDAAAHGSYFKQLAIWVCDGLDACGYVHCPGEMMAMTDTWRQPQQHWAQLFDDWVERPQPKALMLTCVFFDVRVVAGQAALLHTLRQRTLARTRGNSLFLAHMVGNALSRQPPLGLLGGLAVQRSGPHKGTLNLKHNGIVPIVDLARVYALAGGDAAVNTHDRLAHAADSGEISKQGARDLRDALEFLSLVRLRHQSRRMAAGFEADNYLQPDELSNFERSQLKDAFAVVKALQEVLAQRYRMSR